MHKPIEKGAKVTPTTKYLSRTGRRLLSAIVGSLALAATALLLASSALATASGKPEIPVNFESLNPTTSSSGPMSDTTAAFDFVPGGNGSESTRSIQASTFTTLTESPRVEEVQVRNVTGSSAYASFVVVPHSSQTVWRLELADSASGPWTVIPGASGTISQAQAEATPYYNSFPITGGRATGLKPSTVYYVRGVAENTCEHGCGTTTSEVTSFETHGAASASAFGIHALHGEALQLLGSVDANSSPTSAEQVITLEGTPTGGTFALELEGHSTTATTATATLTSGSPTVSIPLSTVTGTGNIVKRSPETDGLAGITDVKVGTGEFLPGHPISGPGLPSNEQIDEVLGSTLILNSPVERDVPHAEIKSDGPLPSFAEGDLVSAAGVPAGTTIAGITYANLGTLPGETGIGTLALSADATASATDVSLTASIPYNAGFETVERALNTAVGAVDVPPDVRVEGPDGGPYTVLFVDGDAGRAESLINGSGLLLTPPGAVSVATTQEGGPGYGAHYHFQYTTQQSFSERGWVGAQESPEADLGPATSARSVGYDLPGFTPGDTYRYRLLAQSSEPGASPVKSGEQSLTAPTTPARVGSAGPCPNEAERTGSSGHLSDCRAYEQITPTNKQAAQEPFHYGQGTEDAYVEVGEEGQHTVLEAGGVNYPGSGQGPYLFSRQEGGAWLMTAGSPQPQTGVSNYVPELYSADATQVAFESSYATSFSKESADVEFELGPVGGPYTTVATVPTSEFSLLGAGWVAANGDFSKLVLRKGGLLYEYTAEGGLSPLNGTCGAEIVNGSHEFQGTKSSKHSISADGSRVFFEAPSGSNCAGPSHLYMRVDGESTVDIGAYKFAAANAQGTTLLLEKGGELIGYNTEDGTTQEQSSGELETARELSFLGIPDRVEAGEGTEPFAHPRYTYWGSGELLVNQGHRENEQAYRYDSVEHLVQCISCASPSDPEPKLPAFLGNNHFSGLPSLAGGFPEPAFASANGEFAFFSTSAALLPEDVNGEIEVDPDGGEINEQYFDAGTTTSPSSDAYEWRGDGVDGCRALQGCLALITDGRAGFHNILLGSADEGRDVFIYTLSKLVPPDLDSAGDIYDARIDGGVAPPPPPPVECEGSACSSPPSPPNDATPSSQTFAGAGNITPAATQAPKVIKPKPKKKVKAKRKIKQKRKGKKSSKQAEKSAKGRK